SVQLALLKERTTQRGNSSVLLGANGLGSMSPINFSFSSTASKASGPPPEKPQTERCLIRRPCFFKKLSYWVLTLRKPFPPTLRQGANTTMASWKNSSGVFFIIYSGVA